MEGGVEAGVEGGVVGIEEAVMEAVVDGRGRKREARAPPIVVCAWEPNTKWRAACVSIMATTCRYCSRGSRGQPTPARYFSLGPSPADGGSPAAAAVSAVFLVIEEASPVKLRATGVLARTSSSSYSRRPRRGLFAPTTPCMAYNIII